MEQKDLSRKADQPGQPGKGKSCWHPLGCSVRFNHWTDSQSATKTLISLISNFSCFDPLYRIMTSFALLWRLFTERKCTDQTPVQVPESRATQKYHSDIDMHPLSAATVILAPAPRNQWHLRLCVLLHDGRNLAHCPSPSVSFPEWISEWIPLQKTAGLWSKSYTLNYKHKSKQFWN